MQNKTACSVLAHDEGSTESAERLREATAAALLLAAASEQWVASGEAAALRHAGDCWLHVARYAARLLAANGGNGDGVSGIGGSGSDGPSKSRGGSSRKRRSDSAGCVEEPDRRGRRSRADDGKGNGNGSAVAAGGATGHNSLWPRGLPRPHPRLADSMAGLWAATGGALLARAWAGDSGGSSGGDGAGERGSTASSVWRRLADTSLPWLSHCNGGNSASSGSGHALVEEACAQACTRARSLLSHHYGPLHAAADAAAFAPMLGRFAPPYALAARIMARAAALHDEGDGGGEGGAVPLALMT
jgi:hypothetical protein